MGLKCGIVGLPNVGKSTIFQAITNSPAEVANYPFCTIGPNQGLVDVSDPRLKQISALIKPEKVVPTAVEFVDIAGLVKGASKGEGLGNQFLGNIRQVDAIVHVVRCFNDDNIIHVAGAVNPIDDIEVIETEIALSDLELLEKRQANLLKSLKSANKDLLKKTNAELSLLERIKLSLEAGKGARECFLDSSLDTEALAIFFKELPLISAKKMLFLCNVDEEGLGEDNEQVSAVRTYLRDRGHKVLKICGKLEADLASIDDPEEKKLFLAEMGVGVSGLEMLTNEAYRLLGLKTFFTAGPKEVRAWTFKGGAKAPEAAGVIHTDFQRGFIKAEVYHCNDLFALGQEQKVKEAGKFRIEGKEYEVQDGDIIHFRFNV